MAGRFAPLSPRQVKVLRWVAEGCPDGVWPDFRYKVTVYALADRGLVTVNRRRHSWQAVITDQGRHYLDHGTWPARERSRLRPQSPASATRSCSGVCRGAASLVTAESLLAELRNRRGHGDGRGPTWALACCLPEGDQHGDHRRPGPGWVRFAAHRP